MQFVRVRHGPLEMIVACVSILSLYSSGVKAADWKERLLSEAPPKWAALEQYYSKMEGSYRTNVATPPGGKQPRFMLEGTRFNDVRVNGNWMVSKSHRVGTVDGKQTDTLSVHGVNSRYAFELGKVAANDDSYILADFQAVSEKKIGSVGGRIELDKAYSVQGVHLTAIIKDQRITITEVRGVQRKGKEWVQIEYDRQLDQKIFKGVQHVVALLDPERYWSFQECHSEDSLWTTEEYVEYGDDVDGFPIPRRSKFTQRSKADKGDTTITTEFDKLVHRDIPESEFTLSAFGLPEMPLPGEQKPRTLWRWLLGIGIALGVLTVLLRVYLKKRRQSMQRI